jgi:hypothetical protein
MLVDSLHLVCSEMSSSVLELPSEVLDTDTNTQIRSLTLCNIPVKLYGEILCITEVLPFSFNLITFIYTCCSFHLTFSGHFFICSLCLHKLLSTAAS